MEEEEEKKGFIRISLSIDSEYKERFEFIAQVTHRNFSNLLRLWIDESFEKYYKEIMLLKGE